MWISNREGNYAVETSLKYSNMSKGTFNPIIRPLVDVWGFRRENQNVPSKNEIEKAMKLVNYIVKFRFLQIIFYFKGGKIKRLKSIKIIYKLKDFYFEILITSILQNLKVIITTN